MRQLPVWSRSLAGMLALWFGLVMVAPVVLHSCPRDLAGAVMEGSAGGHAHHGTQHSDDQRPDAPANCQCLGRCAVSAPALMPGATTILVATFAPRPAEILTATADIAAVVHPDHTQPFATAPPLHRG